MIECRFAKKNSIGEEAKGAIRAKLKDLLAAHPEVLFAYVHGSFVKEREFRDIDVAVHSSGTTDPLHMESDLSHQLSKETGFPVEVRVIDAAPVAFQMAAIRDGIVLLSRSEEAHTDFIEKVGRRYREYKHFRNLFLASWGASVEADRIKRAKEEILRIHRQVADLIAPGKPGYLSDAKATLALKYLLISAVESVVDLCQPILAKVKGVA